MKKIFVLFVLLTSSGIAKSQQENLQELLNRKQYNQIVSYATQLEAADSSDIQTMYLIGQAYEGLLRYRDAYHYYQHCLSLDSTQTELLYSAARLAANLGRIGDAESYFLKIWEADTTDFYANYQLARFYVQIENDRKAVNYYTYLLEHEPNNSVLLRALGDCYYRLNERNKAFYEYWDAFQNNKENAGLASTAINTLLPLALDDKIERALEICDTALIYSPGNKKILQDKGTTFYTARKYSEADDIFSILLAEGDSSYYILKFGGSARYYAGKHFAAIEVLEKAHFEDPTDIDVCLLLGSSYGRIHEFKKAYDIFEWIEKELLKPDTGYTDLLTQFLADTYARDRRQPEAAALYYQLWLTSRRQDLMSNLWSFYGMNDVDKLESDDARARCMFVNVLIATDPVSLKNNRRLLPFVRRQLEKFREEMFFKSMKEYSMIAPDNKRSTITEARLQEIIQQLPTSNN